MSNNDEMNEEEEQYFLERIRTLGFKLSGVRVFDEIPNNKMACLLLTTDKKIIRSIAGCASQNNFVVLFNPVEIKQEHCENLFAFIMDKNEKVNFPYPEYLTDKYIDAKLDYDLINDFLLTLK